MPACSKLMGSAILTHTFEFLKFRSIIWVVILQVICSNTVRAQNEAENLQGIHFNVNNGMPDNHVTFAFEDSKGYIWFGSFSGLCVFNGYQFSRIQPSGVNPKNLFNGQMRCYCKVNDSITLIGTSFDGLFQLNTYTREFKWISGSPSASIALAKFGDEIFVGTVLQGLFTYNLKLEKFNKPKMLKADGATAQFENTQIFAFAADTRHNQLWIGTQLGLFRWKPKDKRLESFYQDSKDVTEKLSVNHVQGLYIENDTLWIGRFFGGLGKWVEGNNHIENFYFDEKNAHKSTRNTNIVYRIFQNKYGGLLLATNNGFQKFYKFSHQFSQLKWQNSASISAGDVSWYFEDSKGNQWFCTATDGVFLRSFGYDLLVKFQFPKQKYKDDFYQSTATDMVYSPFYHGYLTSVGSHDGLLYWNSDFSASRSYSVPNSWQHEPSTFSVAVSETGKIWLTDVADKLIEINKLGEKPEFVKTPKFNSCYRLIHDSKKILFVTNTGLYDYQNNGFRLISSSANQFLVSNIQGNSIWYIDSLNLHQLDLETGKDRLLRKLDRRFISNHNYIVDIYCDKLKRIWLTLEFGGLYCLDLKNGKDRIYGDKDGLSKNLTRVVNEDPEGNIFVLCSGGLFAYIEGEQRFLSIESRLPEKDRDFYEGFLGFSQSGHMLLSNHDILYSLDPFKPRKSKVAIDWVSSGSFAVYNPTARNIELPVGMRNVSISFTDFEFASGGNATFEYLLDEQGNWSGLPLGVNRVSFQLEEGVHQFKVRIKGSSTTAVIYMRVTEKWFRSGWFTKLLFVLILALFVSILAYYFWQKRREIQLNKQISEYKLRVLQLQLNPHFLFNSLTAISALVKLREFERAESVLQDFSKLMRTILEISDAEWISLEDELKITSLYLSLEQARKSGHFGFRIDISNPEILRCKIPPMLLQPYLENSIRHGFVLTSPPHHYEIVISGTLEGNTVILTITDNGTAQPKKSTPEAVLHKSMGLNIQQQRAALYKSRWNLDIRIQSGSLIPNGYRVQMRIQPMTTVNLS